MTLSRCLPCLAAFALFGCADLLDIRPGIDATGGGAGGGAGGAAAVGGGGAGGAGGAGGTGGACAPVANCYAEAVMADSPLAYWRFDEVTDAIMARDEIGDGDGNSPGVYEPSTEHVPGLMQGSGAVQIPNDEDNVLDIHVLMQPFPNFFGGGEPFTLEALIKSNGGDAKPRGILIYKSPAGGLTWQINTGNRLQFHVDNGTDNDLKFSGASIEIGITYHVAVVYDGTNMTLYIDGNEEWGPEPFLSLAGVTDELTLVVGSKGAMGAPNAEFGGIIDDLVIYDHALTTDEIRAHQALGNPSSR